MNPAVPGLLHENPEKNILKPIVLNDKLIGSVNQYSSKILRVALPHIDNGQSLQTEFIGPY